MKRKKNPERRQKKKTERKEGEIETSWNKRRTRKKHVDE